MKEKFTRNMGYFIVLFVIAIYFVISYLFVEGFNENPIVSIIDGVLISIGTIISTISMTSQGIINGRYSEKYQDTLKSHILQKQKIINKLNNLQDWLDYDYANLTRIGKTTFVNSAGFEYEEVFGENGKVLNNFKLPKPKPLELKTKKEKFFALFYRIHYKFFGEEWKWYREQRRFISLAKRYKVTRLTVSDVMNINAKKDPNNFGHDESHYMKKKTGTTILTRLFISFGLPFIAFAYHDFNMQFFLQQLITILIMLVSAMMSMFFAYIYMITENRDGVIKKVNKLEEYEHSDIFKSERKEPIIERVIKEEPKQQEIKTQPKVEELKIEEPKIEETKTEEIKTE